MFPTHHSNSDTAIKGYKGSFTQLTHDQNAYNSLFGNKFSSFVRQNSEREVDINEKNGEAKRDQSSELVVANKDEGMLYPISYTVDHYFTFIDDDKQRDIEVMKFVTELSTTEEMTYFKAAYVQRLLLHIWEETTKY